jgi:hypothetical protein
MKDRFIVMAECANGNASVGTEWIEAKVFESHVSIQEVWEWARKQNGGEGRIMITKDSTTR